FLMTLTRNQSGQTTMENAKFPASTASKNNKKPAPNRLKKLSAMNNRYLGIVAVILSIYRHGGRRPKSNAPERWLLDLLRRILTSRVRALKLKNNPCEEPYVHSFAARIRNLRPASSSLRPISFGGRGCARGSAPPARS